MEGEANECFTIKKTLSCKVTLHLRFINIFQKRQFSLSYSE